MQIKFGSVVTALRRERNTARWLLRFGLLGGPLVIAWMWFADVVLAPHFVALIGLLAVFTYGSVLALMFGAIMTGWSAREPQVAVERAPPPLPGLQERDARPAEVVGGGPQTNTTFHEQYFRLRLREEVAKARREALDLTLVWLEIGVPGARVDAASPEQIGAEMARLMAGQARNIGQFWVVGPAEYVFSIPDQGAEESRTFVSELVQALGNYWCNCGIAVYPRDGADAERLLAAARAACEASRLGERNGKAKQREALAR